MLEIYDIVNVSGIILEIIGFGLLLPEFEKRVRQLFNSESQKGYFEPRFRIKLLKEHSRTIAIMLVISGLTAQGLAVGIQYLN